MPHASTSWRWAAIATLLLAVSAGAAAQAAGRLTPIDAQEFRAVLAGQRGQVVLVNFWATWCRPCLREIPELTALADKYHARGLRLVPVSLDEPGDLNGIVRPFLDKWFPRFRSYARLTPDMDGMVSVVDPAWNELLPTSYLIDRTGKVRARIQGGKPGAEFETAVLSVLDER
jgi:thiol-disulfide isomerase/thioredoxin